MLFPCITSISGETYNHTVIMAMRVYALYEKSRFISTTLFIIAVGFVGFDLVRWFSKHAIKHF